jgi:hypothetical protein
MVGNISTDKACLGCYDYYLGLFFHTIFFLGHSSKMKDSNFKLMFEYCDQKVNIDLIL